jgi:hypothetical protein
MLPSVAPLTPTSPSLTGHYQRAHHLSHLAGPHPQLLRIERGR